MRVACMASVWYRVPHMENTLKNPVENIGAMAMREKTFEELTDPERIQKLNREVDYLKSSLRQLNEAFHKMERHEHGVSGRMLIPLRDW